MRWSGNKSGHNDGVVQEINNTPMTSRPWQSVGESKLTGSDIPGLVKSFVYHNQIRLVLVSRPKSAEREWLTVVSLVIDIGMLH